jgi:chromate transporter
LNYCTLLPGPEAQQLATYLGWLWHGTRGGIFAGLMFVIPGALIMALLSFLYVYGGHLPLVAGLFFGIKTAVLAIVAHAVARIAGRAFKHWVFMLIAIIAFLLLMVVDAPFPLIVIGAALLGYVAQPYVPHIFASAAQDVDEEAPVSSAATFRAIITWAAVWWAPIALLALLLGPTHILVTIGAYFSKLAMLSFGGAYALLAWLAQDAVSVKAWLSAAEMADGLGFAETTPGPTILVTQHVGFLAGWRAPAPFSAPVAAVLAALITTWATFAPSFLWIFAGAPHMERLRANKRLAAALSAITAVVVGVMSYLAIWFGLHLLFGETGWMQMSALRFPTVVLSSFDVKAALLSALAFILIMRLHWSLVRTIAVMSVLGVILQLTA